MGKGFVLVNMNDALRRRAKRTDTQKTRRGTTTSPRPLVRMKRLTLDLPEPLHRAIKKNTAEDGVTMAQKLRALLSEHYRTSEETSWRARPTSFSRST